MGIIVSAFKASYLWRFNSVPSPTPSGEEREAPADGGPFEPATAPAIYFKRISPYFPGQPREGRG